MSDGPTLLQGAVEEFFSETQFIHPHTYTVPGRTQAGLISELPRRVLLGIYIYNGVKSEKHALFQNPVSALELTPF
jgi:hypothetical protein